MTRTHRSDMQGNKTCTKCGEAKPGYEFYPNTNKCKGCTCAAVRANRCAKLEYYREFDRKRNMLPHRVVARQMYIAAHPEIKAKSIRQYATRFPEKAKAHSAVSNAKRDGKLKPGPCAICGAFPVDAHHEDYLKPLDVTWLCHAHHLERHGKRAA